jgi:hypothetical protein
MDDNSDAMTSTVSSPSTDTNGTMPISTTTTTTTTPSTTTTDENKWVEVQMKTPDGKVLSASIHSDDLKGLKSGDKLELMSPVPSTGTDLTQ